MSFLLKKDESLFAPTTDLSTLLNKKDTIVEQRVDNSMLEVIFKRIEESEQPIEMGSTVSSTVNQPMGIDGKQQQPLSALFEGLFRDDNTPKIASSTSATGHDFNIFRVTCMCEDCLKYRETIIQLFLEDFEYNTLWKRLQLLIHKFYDIVPEDVSLVMEPSNLEALHATAVKWVGDGRLMDTKKNIQLSLGSNLPLSNDMTFILVFSMLYRRDPHQLFELLCLQLRTIATTYSEGFKNIIKPKSDANNSEKPTYDPVELLNFILDGYDKVCNAAKTLSPLLFELQRGHLQKFSLTWNLLNKRIYQRWVYWGVKELIPECVLKLKAMLDTEKYKSIVYRFIKFDDEMTLLTFKWREIWNLLNTYHLEKDDIERRNRMRSVHAILKSIRRTQFDIDDTELFEETKTHTLSWLSMEDREIAWAYTVYFLRTKWMECSEPRLYAGTANVQCLKCNFASATHYIDCVCRTCILAGGPCFTKLKENTKQYYCTKCTVFERIDRDYLECVTEFITSKSDEANKKVRLVYQPKDVESLPSEIVIDPTVEWLKDHNYHLSWAVFRHMPTRRPYVTPTFQREHFCTFQTPACTRNECRVATQIIAGLYPLNFSKFLISAYQPLNEEERKGLMNIHHLYLTYLIRKLCNDTKTLGHYNMSDVLLDVDDTDYALLCDIGSAFAECYLTDSTIPLSEALDACFLCDGCDIELNMYWLECIYMSRSNSDSPTTSSATSTSGTRGTDIDEDPKLKELKEIGEHMDKFFLDKSCLQKALIKQEDIIKMTPSAVGEMVQGFAANETVLKQTTTTTLTMMAGGDKERVTSVSVEKVSTAVGSSVTTGTLTFESVAEAKPEARSGDHLAEAIKLAVNQKLNLQLEEELRTLKEEHSVLKDMVRDLEQMKENEEKQIKTTTEKNGHQCCAEHSEFLDNHPNKMCHRGDGQCACYYCSIFGHTECNHGRNNETRDRLRKRLHQQHSKDSGKSSAASIAKNVKKVFNKGSTHSATITKTSLQADYLKKANKISDLLEAKTLSSKLSAMKTGVPLLSTVASSSLPTSGAVPATNATIPNNKLESAGTKRKLQPPIVQQTQNILVNNDNSTSSRKKVSILADLFDNEPVKATSLFDAIPNNPSDFINATPRRPSPALVPEPEKAHVPADALAPKALKKIAVKKDTVPGVVPQSLPPQRIKATRVAPNEVPVIDPWCRIEDIVDFIEGGPSKKDSQKKAAKKAKQKQKKLDVKKISELEQLRDEFHDIFYKESSAKNELKSLKSAKKKDKKKVTDAENNVKKFSKTRSKYETSILELISDLKRNNSEFKFAYLPNKEQQLDKQKQVKDCLAGAQVTEPLPSIVEPPVVSTPPLNIMQQQYQQSIGNDDSVQTNGQQKHIISSCEVSSDPSKRMVTIRRVHLPHSDPQVTVTAKGPSPDKDKLLYTFINGQLVSGVSSDSAEFKAQSISQVQQYHLQHQQLRQQNLNAALNNAAAAAAVASAPQPPVSTSKSDKNEKKKQKKEKQSSGIPVDSIEMPVKVSPHVEVGKKKSKKVAVTDRKDSIDETSSVDTNKSKKQSAKTKKQESSAFKSKDIDLLVRMTKDLQLSSKKTEEKRKVKAPKFEYVDPQYKNNKFDVLDLDDEDYYISEEESVESAPSSPVPVPLKALETSKPSKAGKKAISVKVLATPVPIEKPVQSSYAAAAAGKLDKKAVPIAQRLLPAVATPAKNKGKSSSPATPTVAEVQLSKKQKKKLAQNQLKLDALNAAAVSKNKVDKKVQNAEIMAKSLKDSMQRLNLNDDTTIELVRENHGQINNGLVNPSVSIMEQLNRGIRVEGLQLPPGITLTRVDPTHAEQIRANKQSIEKISQPLPPPTADDTPPHLILTNPMNGAHVIQNAMLPTHMNMPSVDPNGFFMVDTLSMNKPAAVSAAAAAANSNTKKSKKNRRKLKNKKDAEVASLNSAANGTHPKLVTLRNPLFQQQQQQAIDPRKQTGAATAAAQPPITAARQLPLNIDQPAAIIKNENGMFTIRNPALHQALSQNPNIAGSNGLKPSFLQNYNQPPQQQHFAAPQMHQPMNNPIAHQPQQSHYGVQLPQVPTHHHFQMQQQSPDNFSFFSDSATTLNPISKPTTAIGSEVKNAQQQRKQQMAWHQQQQQTASNSTPNGSLNGDIFNHLNNLNPQQSFATTSPSLSAYSFNSDFIGASGISTPPPLQHPSPASSPFYSNNGYNSYTNGPLFPNGTSLTTESPPLSATNNYYDGVSGQQPFNTKNYDDMSFLHNLQPGQRLNSEVTIHNISESKFHREQHSQPIANGVEITRIPNATYGQHNMQHQQSQHLLQQPPQLSGGFHLPSLDNSSLEANLAVGSHRQSNNLNRNGGGEPIHNEFGDSIFAPNQTVNLSELASEERDIESFKRFNYYFKPPANKPKVNFDVKNIVLAKKAAGSSDTTSPSPSLNGCCDGGTPSSFVEDYANDVAVLKLSPASISSTSGGYHSDLNAAAIQFGNDNCNSMPSDLWNGAYAHDMVLDSNELINGMVD